jgi:hypothetical protein
MTQSCWELFDTESGNVIEDFATEQDALDALIDVVSQHGGAAIETFALTHMDSGKPTLIAMQDELVRRIEREMREHSLEHVTL